MRLRHCLILTTISLLLAACNTVFTRDPEVRDSVPVASGEHRNSTSRARTTQTSRDGSETTNQERVDGGRQDPGSSKAKYTDIWERLRDNLMIDRQIERSSVKERIVWFNRHQAYLDRVTDRARPYIYYILDQLEERNMPADLALLPVVESAYHPFAYSSSKASGLWQFISSTGKRYGLKQNWWYDGRRDVVEATRAALDYLEKLHKEFNGDWLLALAAYNTGEGNVARAIERNRKAGKSTDFWSLRLPRETRGYVPSLLAVAELVARPERHGITWNSIPNEPYFVQIDTGGQVDLATAAEIASLSMDELYTLNPAFNRWATDPDGPHRLLIPVSRQQQFTSGMQLLPPDGRVNWNQHLIRRGETLGGIARKYQTSIETLKQANNIRGNLIREGHSLLIPISKQPITYYTMSEDARRFRGLKKTGDGEAYVYTVQRGDTLWDIGNTYGISVSSLCSWNGISASGILRTGQKLNLWLADAGGEASDSSSTVQRVPARLDGGITGKGSVSYEVKKGDSLWTISRRFGTSVANLLKWNNLQKNKPIHPGQTLVLHLQEV